MDQRFRFKAPIFSLSILSFFFLSTFQLRADTSSNGVQAAWAKAWQAENPVWRGIHLGLHSDQQAGALVEQLPKLSKLGVNVLVVEVNYAFDFRSHPEIRPGQFITKARARDLISAAHKHGINVIPQIN